MKARFANGPYDGVVLNFKAESDHIILPVLVTTVLLPDPVQVKGECRYRLLYCNDYESVFQFEAVRFS